jgi:hypothetical protein
MIRETIGPIAGSSIVAARKQNFTPKTAIRR